MKKYIILILLCFSSLAVSKTNNGKKTYSEPPFDLYLSTEDYHGESLFPDFKYYGTERYKINIVSNINGLVIKGFDFGNMCNDVPMKAGNFGRKISKGKTMVFRTGCLNSFPRSFVIITNKGNWNWEI